MSSLQERARALAIAQDFGAEALELNRQLVAADPADAASRTRLGRCYLEAGQLDQAEAEYREVLRLDPKNRIASGGIELIERKRYVGTAVIDEPGPRRERAVRQRVPSAPRPAGPSVSASFGQAPAIFNGLNEGDFKELHLCSRGEIAARFGPRVVDLMRRVNALQSSAEIAALREPGRRQLFRLSRADVHASADHWFVYNSGARWEPQFRIGMYAGPRCGDWVSIGLGFDLGDGGRDAQADEGQAAVRDYFRRFQALLDSARRSLFLGWMIKEGGRIEYKSFGPRLDLHEASQAAEVLTGADADRADWVFLGKWLSPANADDAAILTDPVSLVRTVDRAFAGLLPLWRAVLGK